MTDVSAWDPVDDNNTATPPAGWPEGMMPSGVNNSARMMMGAVRREHDRIVGQIGSTPGTITAPTINVTTVNATDVNATGNIGGANIAASGTVSAAYINSTGNVNAQNALTASILTVSGAASIGGALTVPNIAYSGTPGHAYAFGWDGANTHVYVDGSDVGVIGDIQSVTAGNGLTGGGTTGALSLAMSGSFTGSFAATGTVQGSTLTSTGNINATSGTVTAQQITSSGNVNASGNITANGTLTAFSNANISSTVTAAQLTSTGNINAHPSAGTVTAAQLTSNGNILAAGSVTAAVYVTSSDMRIKSDIQTLPPGSLTLVESIVPRSYRLEAEPEQPHYGFIAQEVGRVMREAGHECGAHVVGEGGQEGIAYNELVVILWSAVTEMAARLKQLEER